MIKQWFTLLTAHSEIREDIVKQWHRLLPKLMKKDRWSYVTGPASATIAVLLDIGWTPLGAYDWRENMQAKDPQEYAKECEENCLNL